MRWLAAFLFPLLMFAQDPDRLVDQLGSDDPMVRAKAEKQIAELGLKARDALKKACESGDLDVRTRAKRLLERIERETAERELERQQRPRKLRLVTLSISDTLENVLAELSKQTGIALKPSKLELTKQVTVEAKGAPLVKVLDQLGVKFDTGDQVVAASAPSTVGYTEGARFAFERVAWEPKAQRQGFIFKITPTVDMTGDFVWRVAAISADGKEQKFETCDVHSPQMVYVPDPKLSDATVTVKGIRRWYCDATVEIDLPKKGDAAGWRVRTRSAVAGHHRAFG